MKTMKRIVTGSMLLLLAGGCSPKDVLHEAGDYLLGTRVAIRILPVAGREVVGDAADLLESVRREGALLDANRADGIFARLEREGVYLWAEGNERALVLPVLEESLAFAERSAGGFDPALGSLTQLWGFSSLTPRQTPPGPEELKAALARSGRRRILQIDNTGLRVLPGTRIDLGAVAKGVLADRAAARLKSLGYRQGILDFGGNILLLGGRPDGRPWRVALRHPREGGRWWGSVAVRDQAVVTSGDYERYFVSENVRYHHILDPETGMPARGCLSVTVVGPAAGVADALSTALFVLGPERGFPLLAREFPLYHALFILEGPGGQLHERTSPGFATATEWKPAGERKSR